jgi:indolepyruvate decarboxylase
MAQPELLFAYGTLGPSGPEADDRAGWVADAVRGRLFDLGPYPVLIDWDDPRAGWVEGHVRLVTQIELHERFDPYEGVAEGLYRRVALTTREKRHVWVYVYPHPLPPGARGPLARWEGPRAAS